MEQSENLEKKILKIISQVLLIEESAIKTDSRMEDICKDSIQIFSLILALEKEFGKKAEYEDLVEIETVGDIFAYVKRVV